MATRVKSAEHEPTVVAGTSSCLVRCSCGWATDTSLADAITTKRDALDYWYEHYVGARRRSQWAP
jgi:hypothetical protein